MSTYAPASFDFQATQATTGGSMWGGIASVAPALIGSFLGTASAVSQIEAQSKATVKQIEAEADNFVFETSIINQQRQEAKRELGDIMTDIGLEALEAEATVRATNAMRGVVGGSVEQGSLDVAMKNNLANADAIRQWRNTDINLLRQQATRRREFEQRTSAMASGIASPSSAFLGTLTGGIQGAQLGMSFMSQNARSDFYKSIFGE
jgi:hypothetical protein